MFRKKKREKFLRNSGELRRKFEDNKNFRELVQKYWIQNYEKKN